MGSKVDDSFCGVGESSSLGLVKVIPLCKSSYYQYYVVVVVIFFYNIFFISCSYVALETSSTVLVYEWYF